MTMRIVMGMSPHGCSVEKMWDPQGISSLNVIVSIADHSHTFFVWGSRGITLENRHQSLLYKVYRARDHFVPPLMVIF